MGCATFYRQYSKFISILKRFTITIPIGFSGRAIGWHNTIEGYTAKQATLTRLDGGSVCVAHICLLDYGEIYMTTYSQYENSSSIVELNILYEKVN